MKFIEIKGAKAHNLKNISLKIPRDKLTVITGLSGSGKSSLAFDTIYAEGQRRYVESLSTYARQFLSVMDKAEIESIAGLSPSISIQPNGNVVLEESLTVNGDLLVTGTSTQVNTSELVVEDSTIELGIVDGSIPTSTTTWDLGVLFNYHDGTAAKKSAVAWEQSRERFVFARDADDGGGIGVDNPQLTFNSYATIEVGSIWVNDCAGQSELIACDNGERTLNNITIDAGYF